MLTDYLYSALDIFDFISESTPEDALRSGAKTIKSGLDVIKSATDSMAAERNSGFLGVAFYDNDIWKLLFKLGINFLVILAIVRGIYYPITKRKDYLFTYMMLSTVIFTICFTLKKFEMEMGMALGLFAIFGIIRYRTDAIAIKEMTYLFIIIGVSVINALANRKMSYIELIVINTTIIGLTYILEKMWLLRHESIKLITYEKIDLIVPEKHAELKADLQARTGLKISRIEIDRINFLNDTAQVMIYYHADEQP